MAEKLIPKKSKTAKSAVDVLSEAKVQFCELEGFQPVNLRDMRELRERYAKSCNAYYSLSALTRRKERCSEHQESLDLLFPLRSKIEKLMLRDIRTSFSTKTILREAFGGAFFGASSKQGTSIRYALASCVPTATCGGLCYAHDGRDRELNHVVRGVLNWCVGVLYEESDEMTRHNIILEMDGVISGAVSNARKEADRAHAAGFSRVPRIRFSHVGEMASTPNFANAVAIEVRRRAPDLHCVVYTRHPNAGRLSSDSFIVNFTLESDSDSRSRFIPPLARIVGSAWDGSFIRKAEINFLEHHVEKKSTDSLSRTACPVTVSEKKVESCDDAKCVRCFVRPKLQSASGANSNSINLHGKNSISSD